MKLTRKMMNILVMVVAVMVFVSVSGCSQFERRTDGSSLYEGKSERKVLASDSSEEIVLWGDKTIKSYNETEHGTNAHDAAIEKTKARCSVKTTTTVGPDEGFFQK